MLADAAVHAYEERGVAGYRRFSQVVIGNRQQALYLIDAQGHDVLGRALPPNVNAMVQAARAQHTAILKYGLRSKVTAYETYSPSGHRYVLVLFTPVTLFWLELPTRLESALIAALLITVTLLCLALARHIAGPIVGLSAAARRVSRGDLSARAPVSATKRYDELADLGADFNEMIGRIETLMGAHQQLLASVSHELRSPLARLNVSLALLSKAGTTQTKIIDRMEQDVSRVDGLIGQLLTLSRLESGITARQRTAVDLSFLLQQVVADSNLEAEASMKNVYADLAGPAILPCADPEALRSACENIIRNAVRFTPSGTAVRIALGLELGGSEVMISVEDSGPGVPEEQLQTIFEPFFRVDRHAGAHEGSGLGLAIATRAVHAHQGSIIALNRRPNGLRIEVRIPITDKLTATPSRL